MEEEPKTGKRRLVLAGIAAVTALVLGGLVVLSPSSASDLATVRPLEPTVRLQQPSHNVFKPITSAVATNQGAKVETDHTGMAEIAYFDDSLTRLGPATEYELATLDDRDDRAIVGDLDIGRTYHRVTELTGPRDRYEVRTPNAVAAVRGTRFIVVCLSSGECIFGVIDGVIDVTSRKTGEVCVVRPGEELTVFTSGMCSPIRDLNLNDPWIRMNLELDGVDFAELQKRLFGDDRVPGTDDDPAPDEVDGDGDGVGDGIAAGGSGSGGGAGGGSGGAGGGGGSGGSGPGSPGSPGSNPGSPPDDVLGDVVDRPGDDVAGGSPTTTARPGQGSTTTTRPGQGNTTTTRPGQGNTTTTRPSGTTTTRPSGTTTTRPGQGTTTTRPSNTTTTQPTSTTSTTTCTGYPPSCS